MDADCIISAFDNPVSIICYISFKITIEEENKWKNSVYLNTLITEENNYLLIIDRGR